MGCYVAIVDKNKGTPHNPEFFAKSEEPIPSDNWVANETYNLILTMSYNASEKMRATLDILGTQGSASRIGVPIDMDQCFMKEPSFIVKSFPPSGASTNITALFDDFTVEVQKEQ